jgi:hypothetical protein
MALESKSTTSNLCPKPLVYPADAIAFPARTPHATGAVQEAVVRTLSISILPPIFPCGSLVARTDP